MASHCKLVPPRAARRILLCPTRQVTVTTRSAVPHKPFAWDEQFSPTKQRLQARACGLVAPTAGHNHRQFRDSLPAHALPGRTLPYLYVVADSPEERLPQGPLASHHRYPQQLGQSKVAYGLDHICHSSNPLFVCTYVARMALTCMSASTYLRTQRLVSNRTGFLIVPYT